MPRPLRLLIWSAHILFQILPLAWLTWEAWSVLWQQFHNLAYARGRLAISQGQARWDATIAIVGLVLSLLAPLPRWWTHGAYFLWTLLLCGLVGLLLSQRAFDHLSLLAVLAALSALATCALLLRASRSAQP